jgi:hypothetical protein
MGSSEKLVAEMRNENWVDVGKKARPVFGVSPNWMSPVRRPLFEEDHLDADKQHDHPKDLLQGII